MNKNKKGYFFFFNIVCLFCVKILRINNNLNIYRALFIIDGKGILRQITMNDLPVGRSVDETLRLVQAFQYTDEHGEVCPAGWKPGQDTVRRKFITVYFEENFTSFLNTIILLCSRSYRTRWTRRNSLPKISSDN